MPRHAAGLGFILGLFGPGFHAAVSHLADLRRRKILVPELGWLYRLLHPRPLEIDTKNILNIYILAPVHRVMTGIRSRSGIIFPGMSSKGKSGFGSDCVIA